MGRGKNEGASDYWKRYEELASGVKDLAIALKANVKTSTLSSWKSGQRFPPANVAVDIAKYLGVSVEYMVCGTTESEAKYDNRLAWLAKKHKDTLEELESLDEQTLKIIRAQIQAVVKTKKSDNDIAAEPDFNYGKGRV